MTWIDSKNNCKKIYIQQLFLLIHLKVAFVKNSLYHEPKSEKCSYRQMLLPVGSLLIPILMTWVTKSRKINSKKWSERPLLFCCRHLQSHPPPRYINNSIIQKLEKGYGAKVVSLALSMSFNDSRPISLYYKGAGSRDGIQIFGRKLTFQ